MRDRFIEIYKEHITRPGADNLLEWLDRTDFFEAPASTLFHLSRPGGLVEHSINVYTRLRALYEAELTRGLEGLISMTAQNEETVAICGLLHDVCKVDVYRQEPKNQKTYDPEKVRAAQKYQVKHDGMGDFIWETVIGYKFDDYLPYGHGEKSVYIISGFMKLTREEAMAIRWHMGPDGDGWRTVGEAFNRFPLAVLTHLADIQATYLDEREEK